MNWNVISNWFVNLFQNPTTWLNSGIAILLFIVKPAWERRKPATKIVCQEVKLEDVIQVGKDVVADLQIHYKGQPVTSLSRYELEIYNQSHETIKNIEIEIDFGQGCHILGQKIETRPDQSSEYKAELKQSGKSKTKLTLNYLNKYRGYSQKIYLSFLCDANLNRIRISGQGEGWSIVRKKISLTRSIGEVIVSPLGDARVFNAVLFTGVFVSLGFLSAGLLLLNTYFPAYTNNPLQLLLLVPLFAWASIIFILGRKAEKQYTGRRYEREREYLLARELKYRESLQESAFIEYLNFELPKEVTKSLQAHSGKIVYGPPTGSERNKSARRDKPKDG